MTNTTPPTKPDLSDPARFASTVYTDLLNQSAQIVGLRILLEQAERSANERAETAKNIEQAVNNLLRQSEDAKTQIAEMKHEITYLKRDGELTKQQVQIIAQQQAQSATRSGWDVVVPVGLIASMLILALAIAFWVLAR